MFHVEKIRAAARHVTRGVVVATIGVALFAAASPASAMTTITLKSATMDTKYWANIEGFGNAYSNGVTFQVTDADHASPYTLFGFCIDIFHDMYINTPLNYTYESNYGDPGQALYTNYGSNSSTNLLTNDQITQLTNLIDTGWLLHQADPTGAATSLQTAAIQAAVWKVANPTKAITVLSANLTGSEFTEYQTAFDNYVAGNYQSLADANDRVFTITDTSRSPMHQTFAVGWPIDNPVPSVPEASTWAMMLIGLGAVGAAVRRRRTQPLAVAA